MPDGYTNTEVQYIQVNPHMKEVVIQTNLTLDNRPI